MKFQICDLLGIICGGWSPALLLPTTGARRSLASKRGLGRCSDHFLGSVISAAPRPFRFGVIETLVPVAMVSLSKKLWESHCFPPIFGGMMVVVFETTDPTHFYVLQSRGAVRRFTRAFLLPLAFAVFTSRHFCGITLEVIPGLGTLRVAHPLLYSKAPS